MQHASIVFVLSAQLNGEQSVTKECNNLKFNQKKHLKLEVIPVLIWFVYFIKLLRMCSHTCELNDTACQLMTVK